MTEDRKGRGLAAGVIAAGAIAVAAGAAAYASSRKSSGKTRPARRTATINADPDKVKAFFADYRHWADLVTDGQRRSVHADDQGVAWWNDETREGAPAGRLSFAASPRGTIVTLESDDEGPRAPVTGMMAEMLGSPEVNAPRHILRRAKMMIETGEVATAANRRADKKEG